MPSLPSTACLLRAGKAPIIASTRLLSTLALLSLASGCALDAGAPGDTEGGQDLGKVQSALARWNSYGFPGGNVVSYAYDVDSPYGPYSAFPRGGQYAGSTYHSTIENELEASWATACGVELWHGGTTSQHPVGQILVSIENRSNGYTAESVANTYATPTIHLSEFHTGNGYSVMHEFGHALTFAHEERRPDYVGPCTKTSGGVTDTLDTAADPDSVMSSGTIYSADCSPNSELTLWDYFGSQELYGKRAPQVEVLTTWYGAGQNDYVSALGGIHELYKNMGYQPKYAEGWIWSIAAPNTLQLKLYYNDTTGDLTFAATTVLQSVLQNNGYHEVGAGGYVYQTNLREGGAVTNGLIRIRSYYRWVDGHYDFVLAANPATQAALTAAGFSQYTTEGYVFGERPYRLLRNHYRVASTGVQERTTTAIGRPLWTELNAAGSGWVKASVKFDSAVLTRRVYGSRPLKTYYNASRNEYFSCAASCTSGTDPITRDGATYTYQQTEGYVFKTNVSDLPLKRYYRSSLQDHVTAALAQGGYTVQTTEGYAVKISSSQ